MRKILFLIFILLSLTSAFADGDSGIGIFTDPRRVEWQTGALYEGRFSDGTVFQMQRPYPRPLALLKVEELNQPSASYRYSKKFDDQSLRLKLQNLNESSFQLVVDMEGKKGWSNQKHFIFTGNVATTVLLDHFVDITPMCLERLSRAIVNKLKVTGFSKAENGAIQNWKQTKFLAIH